jgi:hypothetical protein
VAQRLIFCIERIVTDRKSSYVSKVEVDWFSVNAPKGGPMIVDTTLLLLIQSSQALAHEQSLECRMTVTVMANRLCRPIRCSDFPVRQQD